MSLQDRQTVEWWDVNNAICGGLGVGREPLSPRQMRFYLLSPCGRLMALELLSFFHLFPEQKGLLLYFH